LKESKSAWGRLEVGKVWGACRLPRDGPDHLHLAENHPCPSSLVHYWMGILWICPSRGLV
jgi:hypothetical protein